MERKFRLITSGRNEGQQVVSIIKIVDDSISVLEAVEAELENGLVNGEIFTVTDMNGKQLFTEEIYDVDEPYVCRWCGILIEKDHDVYVENYGVCHCGDCHSELYTNEEWNELYQEWNGSDEDDRNLINGDCYYYTTAP